MTPPWHDGPIDALGAGDDPVAWYVRLDAPAAEAARRTRLSAHDLRDLAGKPHAGTRGERRRLAKLLIAMRAGVHPDAVAITRSAAGAPVVITPAGWHVSVAGQPPHCLIGVARQPIGVDIEPTEALPPPIDAFSPWERVAIADAGGGDLLWRWVAKEAHAKRIGNARNVDPADIETVGSGHVAVARSAEGISRCFLRRFAETIQCVAISGDLR